MLDEQFAREFAERYLDAWNSHDAERIEPHGDSLTWSWRMEGTHDGVIDPPGFASTGKRIDIDGIDVWDFDHGRIEHYRAYYDMAALARQIGAMPPAGSAGERVGVLLQRTQARFAR